MELTATVVQEPSLFNYFRPYVREAMDHVVPEAGAETEYYLVRLLSEFGKASRLSSCISAEAPPLSLQLTQALSAASSDRAEALRQLGDSTLYMSGFFREGLNTRVVDVNYYKDLGRLAYQHLANLSQIGDLSLGGLFLDLARGFDRFVQVLGFVSDKSRPPNHKQVVALYAAWFERGCRDSAARLQRLGYSVPSRVSLC